MSRMHQVEALRKVRTDELEAVDVLRKIRENGGYVLVDINGGMHVYGVWRVPRKLRNHRLRSSERRSVVERRPNAIRIHRAGAQHHAARA